MMWHPVCQLIFKYDLNILKYMLVSLKYKSTLCTNSSELFKELD